MAWNPTYKLNLLEVLKRSISNVKIQDKLRPTLKEAQFKKLYGNRIVDEIVKRTRDQHIDKNGKSLGTYKPDPIDNKTGKPKFTAYKDTFVFEVYKGGQKEVDLHLTGEMLASLQAENTPYTIIINLDDQTNRDKAQGHITGRYGKKGKTKPRDFLGLPNAVADEIFKEAIKDYRDLTKLTLVELSI